ncbi:MAG: serine/threonine protein kinase [Anaerolineaceae bacterium]|nr:serine/threonine protein kinase [Anaerolineaceae bacterium]
MSDLVGKDLGRYHIIEQIGEGGMATVFMGYDHRLDRNVAIKVIKTSSQDEADFLKRFEREAKALASLAHPNIVKVHDYGDEDGIPYLVMEYIDGVTLKKKMGSPVHFQEAAKLILPIAQALDYAHQKKIIHRDIKPANIMVTHSNIPLLTDFGIAKMLAGDKATDLTKTGVGIGTPDYMAPEQGKGSKIDHRADIYALGIVFYELVTGKKPFRADTPMAIVVKHITEPLPRPKGFIEDLPDSVEKVIFKALAKNPDNRFQSMNEFYEALERLSYGQTVEINIGNEEETISDLTVADVDLPFQPETKIMPPPSTEKKVRKGLFGKIDTIEKQGLRTFTRISTILGIILLSLSIVILILSTIGAVVLSKFANFGLSTSELYSLGQTEEQFITEKEFEDIMAVSNDALSSWLYDASVDFQAPDQVILSTDTSYGEYDVFIILIENDGNYRFILKKINKIPLSFIGGIISNGVNQGFYQSLENANLTLDEVQIRNDRVTYTVSPID